MTCILNGSQYRFELLTFLHYTTGPTLSSCPRRENVVLQVFSPVEVYLVLLVCNSFTHFMFVTRL
jgi:hypothetical protein